MTSVSSYVQTFNEPQLAYPSASIFFPAAMCNLGKYIRTPANFPGKSHVKRMQHVRQMLSICKGLEWLSKNLVYKPADGQYVYTTYYHCDFKPDNILVCEGLNEMDPLLFKIADFGEARGLHRTPHDLSQLKEVPDQQILVSGREGAFIAPEAQDEKATPEVTGKSDVWALGCVFLLVILFNYDGASEIENFDKERERRSHPKRRGNHFFQPTGRNSSDIRNPAVTTYIDNLIIRTQTWQLTDIDAKFANEFLKYLKDNILIPHKSRHSIKLVTEYLHCFYNDESPISATKIRHQEVPRDSEHCSTTPTGLVFFYTPSSIVFYSHKTNRAFTVEPTGTEKWSKTVLPTSRSCSNRTLCLVSKVEDYGFKVPLQVIITEIRALLTLSVHYSHILAKGFTSTC
jgi:serine/threonine protein kinase